VLTLTISVLILTIAAAALLAACIRGRESRIPSFDQEDLARYRRDSEEKCRDWLYPFE
jgi:hypothetical protein